MNIIKCSKGHFFDKDKYKECPHCKEEINLIDETMDKAVEVDMPKTVAYYQDKAKYKTKPEDSMKIVTTVTVENATDVNCKEDVSKENEIVVGWLVGISGYAYGRAYHLYTNETEVKGCIIGFNRDNQQFYLNYNSSKGYIYINDSEVSESIYLNYMDVIIIEGFQYMLVPLCKDGFSWWETNQKQESQVTDNTYNSNTNNDILSIDDVMNYY